MTTCLFNHLLRKSINKHRLADGYPMNIPRHCLVIREPHLSLRLELLVHGARKVDNPHLPIEQIKTNKRSFRACLCDQRK